jgi:LysM repeat protein
MRLLFFALTLLVTTNASAFTHVVRKGESLASISQKIYGDPSYEKILVGANALDSQGGSAIAAGMRLEIPVLFEHRTALGDTWGALADRFLGDESFSTVLAEANQTHAWYLPDPGSEIVIPYILRHLVRSNETIFDIADRYLGDKMLAWQLVVLNDIKNNEVRTGDVVLVPLLRLPLTKDGEAELAADRARNGIESVKSATTLHRRQEAIDSAIGDIAHACDDGKWIDAIAVGNRIIGAGDATRSQLARTGKLLAYAYAAVDSQGAAIEACRLYLQNAGVVHLEPAFTSPKVVAVCQAAKSTLPN